MLGITNREFPGTILEGEDPKDRGRYLVHIPELMYTIYDTEQNGIYCANHTHKWRDTSGKRDSLGNNLYGGSYYPLLPDTRVIVKFFSEDYASGYIDRVIGDYYTAEENDGVSCMPGSRDNYYQVIKTKENDIIAIDTSAHKLWIHYTNEKKPWVIIELNDEGFFLDSKTTINITADQSIGILSRISSVGIKAKTVASVHADSTTSISAGQLINIKSPKIDCDGCDRLIELEKRVKLIVDQCCDGGTIDKDE